MSGTLGVLAQPLAEHAKSGRYCRAIAWRANPRSSDYMRERFTEAAPGGRVVEAGPDIFAMLPEAGEVILLYPDAIGLGWGPIERTVFRAAPGSARIEVLNGRRRRFMLDARTRRALWLRRLLEWTMLVELLAASLIVGLAPVLWLIDALRGKR